MTSDAISGLTRLSYHLMVNQLSLTRLSTVTAIPVPTLSMYANGHRNISARHRSIIANILGVPTHQITGYCTTEVIVTDIEQQSYEDGLSAETEAMAWNEEEEDGSDTPKD
jgi:hypothetical protein